MFLTPIFWIALIATTSVLIYTFIPHIINKMIVVSVIASGVALTAVLMRGVEPLSISDLDSPQWLPLLASLATVLLLALLKLFHIFRHRLWRGEAL